MIWILIYILKKGRKISKFNVANEYYPVNKIGGD